MPKISNYNKNYIKAVLEGTKKLMKMKDAQFFNVPAFNELSVKKLTPIMRAIKEVNIYLPEDW